MQLRQLRQQDNEAIARIIRDVLSEHDAAKAGTVYFDPTTDDLFSLFQKDRAVYWVAKEDNEILGGAGVYPTANLPGGYCELVKLYLLKNARGKGVGKMLIDKCFESARSFGYSKMYLESMPELKTAVGMYQKLGFKTIPGPLGESGHFGCDIWMVKDL